MSTKRICKIPGLPLALSAILILLPLTAAAHPRTENTVVKGAATTAATGKPMADVTIRVFSMTTAEPVAEAVTSDEGKVEFSGLPYGLYLVSADPPEGYAAVPGGLVYLGPERLEVSVDLVLVPWDQDEDGDDEDDGAPLVPILLGIGAGVAIGALTIATVVENRTQ